MQELEIEDARVLRAVSGWLDLGNTREAEAEFAQLSPGARDHAEALGMRWEIEAKNKDWQSALATAQRLLEQRPDGPDGWIKQSFSLHELKRTQEAWDELLAAEQQFSQLSVIPYNLACYACQLGRMDEAKTWLGRAFKLAKKEGEKDHFKKMALADRDLAALREEIEKL